MKTVLEATEEGLRVTIPSEAATAAQLRPGVEVDVRASAGQIVLSAVAPPTLEELLAGITSDNIHPETDWGPPVGKEVW
jgi:antitoxin MazE